MNEGMEQYQLDVTNSGALCNNNDASSLDKFRRKIVKSEFIFDPMAIGEVHWMEPSDDHSKFALAHNSGQVTIHDVRTKGKVERVFGARGDSPVNRVMFARGNEPDHVYSTHDNGELKVWDLKSGLLSEKREFSSDSLISICHWGEKLLTSTTTESGAILVNPKNYQIEQVYFTEKRGNILHPIDQERFAIGTGNKSAELQIFNEIGNRLERYETLLDLICSFELSQNGNLLFFGGVVRKGGPKEHRGYIYSLNLINGQIEKRYEHPGGMVLKIQDLGNGSLLVVQQNVGLFLHRLADNSFRKLYTGNSLSSFFIETSSFEPTANKEEKVWLIDRNPSGNQKKSCGYVSVSLGKHRDDLWIKDMDFLRNSVGMPSKSCTRNFLGNCSDPHFGFSQNLGKQDDSFTERFWLSTRGLNMAPIDFHFKNIGHGSHFVRRFPSNKIEMLQRDGLHLSSIELYLKNGKWCRETIRSHELVSEFNNSNWGDSVFSEDGSRLVIEKIAYIALGKTQYDYYVYDFPSLDLVSCTRNGSFGATRSQVITSDGSKFAMISNLVPLKGYRSAYIVSTRDCEILHKLEHPEFLGEIALNENEQRLLCLSRSGNLYEWDILSGELVRTGKISDSPIFGSNKNPEIKIFDVISEGKELLISTGRAIIILDIGKFKIHRQFRFPEWCSGVTLNPEKTRAILAFENKLGIVDLHSLEILVYVNYLNNGSFFWSIPQADSQEREEGGREGNWIFSQSKSHDEFLFRMQEEDVDKNQFQRIVTAEKPEFSHRLPSVRSEQMILAKIKDGARYEHLKSLFKKQSQRLKDPNNQTRPVFLPEISKHPKNLL